ncbi:hypothetical protein ABT010_02065 [Streptomyces sp. NPDC002668]
MDEPGHSTHSSSPQGGYPTYLPGGAKGTAEVTLGEIRRAGGLRLLA